MTLFWLIVWLIQGCSALLISGEPTTWLYALIVCIIIDLISRMS